MSNVLEQVLEARTAFTEAHVAAETATARYAELKAKVGGNEADRKVAKRDTPEDIYAGYLTDYAAGELDKIAAVAVLERAEKNLNVLREELQHESAEILMRAAERHFEAVTVADTTAQRYAVMPGNYTTFAEFRARYPQKPVAVPAGGVDDPDSLLPF